MSTESGIPETVQQEIRGEVAPILEQARACTVATEEQYTAVVGELQGIKGAQKRLAEKKRAILGPAEAAVKAIKAFFAEPEATLLQAENLYKREIIDYQDRQERIRREEQRKLDEAAAAERAKREKQAEEARAQAEAARQAGDAAKAEKLEARAEAREEQAVEALPAIAQVGAPKVAGVSTRETWSALVTNLQALIAAVAAGEVPHQALAANQVFLNQQARALKRDLHYPGVTAVRDRSVAAQAR